MSKDTKTKTWSAGCAMSQVYYDDQQYMIRGEHAHNPVRFDRRWLDRVEMKIKFNRTNGLSPGPFSKAAQILQSEGRIRFDKFSRTWLHLEKDTH